MNSIFKIFLILFSGVLLTGCNNDDDFIDFNQDLPTNIDAQFILTTDNSGEVTIIPKGEGANSFIIEFGDGSDASEEIAAGQKVVHIYEEGQYEVIITAKNLAGDTVSITKTLIVSFLPPENLEVTITIDNNNPFLVNVFPTADNAVGFEVYFGEIQDEEPQNIVAGDIAQYTYSTTGVFTITVVALSGGEATLTYSEEIEITDPLVLPIDFESETVNYAFFNFGGGEALGVPVVQNPAPNNVNSSAKVGQYTKVSGSEVWAGTSATLNENIDFSSTQTIAIDVYSPQAGIPVLFKVEKEGDGSIFAESTQNTTVANQWETLTFNLTDINPAESYSVIALFFNFGTSGADEDYYFDNIRLTNPFEIGLPIDFEGGANSYPFVEFGGAPVSIIANPDASGINTSANVAEMLKASGSEPWAGAFIDLDEDVDFGISSTISIKVWSPQANVPFTMKFENPGAGTETEVSVNIPTANQWIELEFDFSGAGTTGNWTRLVLFYNLGTPGAGELIYFDDIEYSGGSGPTSVSVPLTFEGSLDYTWTGFGGAETQVINNPDPSGINTSNRVAELFKDTGAEVWAGSFLDLDEPIDFSNTQQMSMKVWSPINNANVILKLESPATGYEIEVSATTSVANQWHELTFDFSSVSLSENIDRVVIFMDFGNPGNGNTFYFDDIQLEN
ncbi:hypothetical protein [Planktosalinus lacus]|uniref:PKD/Chitinase domain-containing protein n=1 Tax=Planktosalinus lacus TaxID=1526573 RepID=A0A8J2VB13_9FLAO|nr:hypothetical protein [Planktosalinus lacus]GGD95380.1 hypothetical protein GCM10011312_18820 [Planktosalinus lacus]